MAEGFQSSEESGEVPSVASVDKEKSDEKLHEGSMTTGGDTGTGIEQLQDTIENLMSLNEGHEHGRLVHAVHSTSNPISDENNRKLLMPKCYDELVEHVATSSHLTYQEIIAAQQEKLQYLEAKIRQLELELGRRSFLEDKQKRNMKAYQSFRAHANEQSKSCSASGASHDFTGPGMKGKPLGGAGLLQEPCISLQPRLLEISNSLSDVELRQMKFLAKPRVNAFQLAKIREGFELFEVLDASGVLSCAYVSELLKGIQRFDLLEKLDVPLLGNAESADSACHMEEAPEHKPRLHSPNGQKALDGITKSPVIPPGDYNLGQLSEGHGGCDERLAGGHMQNNKGDHRVSGTNKADSGSNMSCRNSEKCGSGMGVLPMGTHCDDLQRQPTDKWVRCGARPKTRPVNRTPLEPSLAESLTCGLPDAVHVPVDSSEIGIHEEFMERHSIDRSPFESLRHSSIENELTSDASLPGASYMESMMNFIAADRMKPHTVDDEVASRPDKHNRLGLSLLVRQDERGYAVGGSTFEESLDGTTGPDCTLNSDPLPSTSVGNMARVAAGNFDLLCPYSAGRSNRVSNRVLSEAESTAAHPYASGNASSTCNLLNPVGNQGAVVSEPCHAESASSRDSMSDGNAVSDELNSGLLALAQLVVSLVERQIEGEGQREARVRAWNWNGWLQGQASPPPGQANPVQAVGSCLCSPFNAFITESLDSAPNSARAQARREAAVGAPREEMRRGLSSCSGPVEHSCVCLENDGSQTCRVLGTIVPERCQPDLAHDKCCKCWEDVSIGSKILPCSHRVHTECLVGMIQNDEVNCPICGRAFLGRS